MTVNGRTFSPIPLEFRADFKAALASCKREAISSFGDDKVLIEKYLTRPRNRSRGCSRQCRCSGVAVLAARCDR